jgi:hypothetical protein
VGVVLYSSVERLGANKEYQSKFARRFDLIHSFCL